MKITTHVKQYSRGEEIANSIIHGIGALLGIVGMTVLLVLAVLFDTRAHFISYLIYGASLIFLYSSSTLYHALPFIKAKQIFKILDHIGIYFLIAGTYTPFLVLNLAGPWAVGMLIAIWSLALVGSIFKLFFTGRFTLVSTLMYIAMGWLVIIAYKPMTEALSRETLMWILLGGFFYTTGTIVYLMKRVAYHHAVWHAFVLAGSIAHFVAIVGAR
jgi:hemolysin III